MEEFKNYTDSEINKFIKEEDQLKQNLKPVDIAATYNISDSSYDKILENTLKKKPTSGGYKNKQKKKNKLTSDIIIDLLKN